MSHSFLTKKYVPAAVMAVVAFVLALAWRLWCVPYADDYIYSHVYEIDKLDCSEENYLGAPIQTVADVAVSLYRHYVTAYGRLGNNLAFVSALLPHWLVVMLTALSTALFPFLVVAAGGGRRMLSRPLAVALSFVAVWLFFPWSDGMQSLVFHLNYVESACMSLAVVVLMRRVPRMGVWAFAAALLAAFAAAWMHEGFGAPLVAVLFFIMLLRGVCWRDMAMVAASLAGFAAAFSPGTFHRMLSSTGSSVSLGVLLHAFPAFVFVAVAAYMVLCHRRALDSTHRFVLAMLGGVLCSIVVCVASGASVRAYWPALMYALCGFYAMAAHRDCAPDGYGWLRMAWVPVFALYVAFGVALVVQQHKAAGQYYQMHGMLVGSPGNFVFSEAVVVEMPWYVLDIPHTGRYSEYIDLLFENEAAGRRDIPVFMPDSCRDLSFDRWPCVAGDNPFRGTPGQMVADTDYGDFRLTLRLGDPGAGMSPIARVLLRLAGGSESRGSVDVDASCHYIGTHRGDSLYRVIYNNPGRIYRNRSVSGVDFVNQKHMRP